MREIHQELGRSRWFASAESWAICDEMKLIRETSILLALLAAITVTYAAASGNNYGSEVSRYNDDAYESYGEGGYNEDSQDVSVVEEDMFREYIVHEERFCQV